MAKKNGPTKSNVGRKHIIGPMKLHPHWKRIVKRAWSMKLMAATGVLTGLEVMLPLFFDSVPSRLRFAFGILSCLTIAAAFVSRIVVQKNLR